MNWHVGQKVVCVTNDYRRIYNEVLPQKGRTYTIREISTRHPSFRLVEIVNSPQAYWEGRSECYFDSIGFRPLDELDAIQEEEEVERDGIPLEEPELVEA